MSGNAFEPRNEEAESQLTAHLLGELSPEEDAVIRRRLETDPEFARLRDQLRQTFDLVREALAQPAEPLCASAPQRQLSETRRKLVLERLASVDRPGAAQPPAPERVIPVEFPASERNWNTATILAACLVALAGLSLFFLPDRQDPIVMVSRERRPAGPAAFSAAHRLLGGRETPPPADEVATAPARGRADGDVAASGQATEMSRRSRLPSEMGVQAGREFLAEEPRQVAGSLEGGEISGALAAASKQESQAGGADGDPWSFGRSFREARFAESGGIGGGGMAGSVITNAPQPDGPARRALQNFDRLSPQSEPSPASALPGGVAYYEMAPEAGSAEAKAAPASADEAAQMFGLGAREEPLAERDLALHGNFAGEEIRLELEQLERVQSPALLLVKEKALKPQVEELAARNPISTFSLNVSDVSFKLADASLAQGVLPDPDTVRVEEFLNAFDYRDPAPPPGAPVALAWERARHPFLQDREALRLSVKTAAQGRESGRPMNLVVLLDNSGSMERADRVRIVREALQTLCGKLQPQDRVSLVSFARTPRLWVDGVPGDRAGEVADTAAQLTPEGGTNLEDALAAAYETALKHFVPEGNNRVILLTDGAANLGDSNPESLRAVVEARRTQGVALDCFGVGWEGYNDTLLESLSRRGDGRYGFLNSTEEAGAEFAEKLAGALQVAAADVKTQVEFNPRRVALWRQAGHIHHQLAAEDFRNNAVDAAEIGAAESGNALYVLQIAADGEGPIGVVRVRYRTPGTARYEEHEWLLPYSQAASEITQATPAMKLAVAAVSFAERLANSPFAGEATPDRLLELLSGVPDAFAPDPRPARLVGMIREARAISGE